jgi:hypothetical protein
MTNVFGSDFSFATWWDELSAQFAKMISGEVDWRNVDWSKVKQKAQNFHGNLEEFLYYFLDRTFTFEESWDNLT